ncbi:MAG: DEAD/DEAH box helicase family protein [Chloroflexota bacterium]
MRLKDFQLRTLASLRDFFRACVKYKKPHLAFAEITIEKFGLSVPYIPAPELPDLPYVCLRLPTGGGKTLVAAHSVEIAAREYLQTDAPLVVWLVPSNAILNQTLAALKNRKHPYRQALETIGTSVTVLDMSEALSVQPAQMNGVTVVVSTMQAVRVEDTANRKFYEQNGSLMGHFPSTLQPRLLAALDKHADGKPVISLANVFALRRPIVIVDEAHNARTDLSFTTLARFSPSCIIEFTATPAREGHPSNVLHTVSAAELKAEGMIKLPIYLETQQDWRAAIAQAVGKRNELEALARAERAQTGEYLRPILLLQAQPTYKGKPSITVEMVKECLIKDNQIPEEQIKKATGEEYEIEGLDLLAEDSPVRYIITKQALREGWDCPFAYVLCSVAEMSSATAVEQILGRVLRLPNVTKKQNHELNYAYAYVSSLKFGETAKALQDALIHNGFERQEVKDLVRSTTSQPWLIENAPLFNIPAEEDEARQEIRQTPFSIPILAVKQGKLLEPFDESFFLESPVALAQCDPYLSEEEFPKDSPDAITVEIDVSEAGKLKTNFIHEAQSQAYLIAADQKVTKQALANWLDRSIPHRSIPQSESLVFLLGMVERLLENRRWTLEDLWREKYRLREAARRKIEFYQAQAETKAFQDFLFSPKDYELVVTPQMCFTFNPEDYPYPANSTLYQHGFKKHYYQVIGDLKPGTEEFDCAQLLDTHPKVKRWVRNLEGHPQFSFWLQTSTDKFYPDFVCELTNGKFLVVEYKGEHLWSNDDSKEKRMIGERWAELSKGKCLFVMPNGKDWNAIRAKLK